MASFIRKVPTASGARAVQIVHKQGRRVVGIEHIGSAHDDAQLAVLMEIAHPCSFGTHVWDAVCDWRGLAEDDTAEARRLDEVIWAWRHDMEEHGVSYRVSTAGRESAFESWLVDDLSVLGEGGSTLNS